MTEERYLDHVNRLLATATPVGAYCLAFAEALRQRHPAKTPPPLSLLKSFVACATLGEGYALYEEVLGQMNNGGNRKS